MDEEDDPFGWISKHCRPTSSQDSNLRNCPFARESEVFPGDDDHLNSPSASTSSAIPVEPARIVMVSPPGSPREGNAPQDNEDFQTPSEGSLAGSSQEQDPRAAAVDTLCGSNTNGGGDAGETMVVEDDGCAEGEDAVDLVRDSDSLGFSGVKFTQVIDSEDGVAGDRVPLGCARARTDEVSQSGLLASRALLSPSSEHKSESLSVKLNVADKKLGSEPPSRAPSKEPMIMESEINENVGSGFTDSVGAVGKLPDLNVGKIVVDLPQRGTKRSPSLGKGPPLQKNGRASSSKNAEDLERFKYVSSSVVGHSKKGTGFGGHRELPSSISRQAKGAGGRQETDAPVTQSQILKGLLDALTMVAGDDDESVGSEEVDFLETAKRRGMTFPRPRWWPPEGFGD